MLEKNLSNFDHKTDLRFSSETQKHKQVLQDPAFLCVLETRSKADTTIRL